MYTTFPLSILSSKINAFLLLKDCKKTNILIYYFNKQLVIKDWYSKQSAISMIPTNLFRPLQVIVFSSIESAYWALKI